MSEAENAELDALLEFVRRAQRAQAAVDDLGAGRPPTHPGITCPVCRITSYNINDITHGYCGHCNAYTSPEPGGGSR